MAIARRMVMGWVVGAGLVFVAAPLDSARADEKAAAKTGAAKHDHAHGDASHHGHDHDEGHDDHHVAPKVHGKEPAGLMGKGTEFLAISPQLLLWTVALFLILSFLLKRLVWTPILASMDEREQKVEASLAAAKQARDEAQSALDERNEALSKINDEIRVIIEKARDEATKESEALLAKARDEAASKRHEAESEIAAARDEALAEIRKNTAKLAVEMIAKTSPRRFAPSDLEDLVAEVQS